MARTTALAEAKKRAREAVAQVKQRVARQEGAADNDEGGIASGGDGAGTTHAQTRGRAARVQGHPAARTQRTQGRREGGS